MGTRVIVDEDDLDIAAFVRDLLEIHGFEVITLASSISAHALIRDLKPDVVITDLEVEGREDGLRLLAELRADAATAHIAAILYTANHDYLEQKQDAIKALGARRVRKLFAPDELIKKIEAALAAA